MSMILLDEPVMLDLEKISKRLGGCPVVNGRVDQDEKESALFFEGKLYSIIERNYPLPERAYESLVASTHFWSDAMDSLRKNKRHIYVASRPNDKTLVDQLIDHTTVTMQVVAEMPVCGIIWGSSTLTNIKQFQFFTERLVRSKILPIMVWIQIQVSVEQNGELLVSTNGMRDYGLMELEINTSPLPLNETLDVIEDFISYIINYGPIIEDGHTIGGDREIYDKIITVRVRETFREAFREDVGSVYLLDFR